MHTNKYYKAIMTIVRIILYADAIAVGRYAAFIRDNGNDRMAIGGLITSLILGIVCFICMDCIREIQFDNK